MFPQAQAQNFSFPVFQNPAQQSIQGLAPPFVAPGLSAEWLRGIFNTIPESEQGLLPMVTDQESLQLLNLKYPNGADVISIAEGEVVLEVVGYLRTTPASSLIEQVKQCKDKSDLLWLASQHRESYVVVAREVFILQVEESGIKGIVKCRRCGSSNVLMMSKQLRSGDEPTTIFTRCVDCKETWKQ